MSEQEAQAETAPIRVHPDAPIPYAGNGPEYMVDYSSPLARAYDPEAFEDHPIEARSPVAAIQWSARRKLATDAADRVIASGLLGERARHVPVEVTEAQVERMAKMMFAHSTEGRAGFSWPLNGDRDRQRDMAEARRKLEYVLAALGGGE